MFGFSEMGFAFWEYVVWREILPPPCYTKAICIPTLKLPSLEGRSDVNVWSSPSRFFGKKENNTMNDI